MFQVTRCSSADRFRACYRAEGQGECSTSDLSIRPGMKWHTFCGAAASLSHSQGFCFSFLHKEETFRKETEDNLFPGQKSCRIVSGNITFLSSFFILNTENSDLYRNLTAYCSLTGIFIYFIYILSACPVTHCCT